MSWRASYVRERKRRGAEDRLRTCGGEICIVTESCADLELAVRVPEALSQAPVPEAGLRRMDLGQEHLPIERVPPIGRRSAPCEVGDHRFQGVEITPRLQRVALLPRSHPRLATRQAGCLIIAVRREPSGFKWSRHGMVLHASTRMLAHLG